MKTSYGVNTVMTNQSAFLIHLAFVESQRIFLTMESVISILKYLIASSNVGIIPSVLAIFLSSTLTLRAHQLGLLSVKVNKNIAACNLQIVL
jgi:hypothetical protein